jgi:[citrate (pro-3S)-lyase] ligase
VHRHRSLAAGEGLSLKLLTELLTLAYELGRSELFLFTKPCNAALFSGAGFWPIAQAGDRAVLMENSRERLTRYCRQLAMYRQPGRKIGAIVMNANPFTLGHRWLVEQAARQCDWLHLFVVKEDASVFTYQDRFANRKRDCRHRQSDAASRFGISHLAGDVPRLLPQRAGVVDDCHSQIDLQLFRERLAPALQITHRFVGTEPLCSLTRHYNQRMKALLEAPATRRLLRWLSWRESKKRRADIGFPGARTVPTAQLAGGRGAGAAGNPLFSDATGGKRTSNRLIFTP